MMIGALSNRSSVVVEWEQKSTIKGTEKTAKNAMTDGFIERIKAYAKEDAMKRCYYSIRAVGSDAYHNCRTGDWLALCLS